MISFLAEEDLTEVSELFSATFNDIYGREVGITERHIRDIASFEHSLVMREQGGIIGAYLLRPKRFNTKYWTEDMRLAVAGLQGVCLAIEPSFQRQGRGSLMVRESEKIAREHGLKYIFGGHDKILNNLAFWLKHRDLTDAKEHFPVGPEGHTTIKFLEG